MVVILDSGPLGLASNPKASPANARCKDWLAALLRVGTRFAIPEITDYELRRELLRAGRDRGVRSLDALKARLLYVPLTTEAMLRAAGYWAQCRQKGFPLADPDALDVDVILAAQATLLGEQPDEEVIVATTNPDHLSRLVPACHWEHIRPIDSE